MNKIIDVLYTFLLANIQGNRDSIINNFVVIDAKLHHKFTVIKNLLLNVDFLRCKSNELGLY